MNFEGVKLPERRKYGPVIYDSKGILREDAGQYLNGLQDDKRGAASGSEIWAVLEDFKKRL